MRLVCLIATPSLPAEKKYATSHAIPPLKPQAFELPHSSQEDFAKLTVCRLHHGHRNAVPDHQALLPDADLRNRRPFESTNIETLKFCHFVDSQESEVFCDIVSSCTAPGRSEARTNSGPVWFGASQIQYEAGGSRVKTFLQNLLQTLGQILHKDI